MKTAVIFGSGSFVIKQERKGTLLSNNFNIVYSERKFFCQEYNLNKNEWNLYTITVLKKMWKKVEIIRDINKFKTIINKLTRTKSMPWIKIVHNIHGKNR